MLKSVLFLAAAIGAAAPLLAQTALTTSNQSISVIPAGATVTLTQTANTSATTTFAGTVSASNSTTVAANNFTAFNTNTGILVGAKMNVDMNYYTSLAVQGVGQGGIRVTALSNIGARVSLNGGTLSSTSGSLTVLCSGGNCQNGFNNNIVFGPTQGNNATNVKLVGTAAASGNLAGFALGSQTSFTFVSQVTATNTTLTSSGSNAPTSMSARSQVVYSGSSFNLSYDYLNFSTPSFTTGTQTTSSNVNLGTVYRGSTAAQTFNITNIAAAPTNTSPTSLTSVTGGNAGVTTSLTSLSNLAGGQTSGAFSVGLNTSTVGAKSGTFTYAMTDTPTVGGVAVSGATGMRTTNLTQTVTGTVIDHANPSFNGSSVLTSQTLDFGTPWTRGGVVTRSFSIFNLGDINTAALELYNVTGPGNARFTSNISPFLSLAGGQSNTFTVNLDPLNYTGPITGSYRFFLRDNAPGVAGGRNYELTLNLTGDVDPVPEPGTWLTMLLGFGMVGAVARRRAAVRA